MYALAAELAALVGFLLPWKDGDDSLVIELWRYLFDGGEDAALQLWESQSALFPLAFIVPLAACVVTVAAICVMLISRVHGRTTALSASLMSCIVIAGPAWFFRLPGPLQDSFDAMRRLEELDVGWYLALIAALVGTVATGYGYLRETKESVREPAGVTSHTEKRRRERCETITLALVATGALMVVVGYYGVWTSYSLEAAWSDNPVVREVTGEDFTYPIVLIPASAFLSLVFLAGCMALRRDICSTVRLFGEGSSVFALALALFLWFTWPEFHHFSRSTWMQDPELGWGWWLCVAGETMMLAALLWTGRVRRAEPQPEPMTDDSVHNETQPSMAASDSG